MYDFHYEYMMKKFPGCKLLFTDTDSFCYSIPNVEDIDEALDNIEAKEIFDFSNYPEGHPLFNLINKMVPGKFKDQCPNMIIIEFVGLRAKMYSL